MNYEDITKMSMGELSDLIMKSRETLREERFKDRFTKKASIIRATKLTIAQAMTEIIARESKGDTK